MSENGLPYSYHTFLFPFIWKTDVKVKKDNFIEKISVGEVWIERKWNEVISSDHLKNVPDPTNEQLQKREIDKRFLEWFQNYQANQYFTDAANMVVFNENGENVVQCYEYHKNKGSYIIRKGDKAYFLKINKIRLNIYDAGIAVLIFEMENYDHRTLDDVDSINEYGRRINFPFFTYPEIGKKEEAKDENRKASHPLCADSITIYFPDGTEYVEDYNSTLMNAFNLMKVKDKLSFSYVMSPIQDILDGGKHKITANKNHKTTEEDKEKFYIKPCVDDRMFVCCVVMDNELSNELKGCDTQELSCYSNANVRLPVPVNGVVYDAKNGTHYNYKTGWADETTLVNRLYKFAFIENELSCQDPYMKLEILKNSLYTRWIHTGTIHGVTHHSFVCLTNSNVIVSVVNPFLTQYVQMAILALAQRSVVLMLEDDVASISNKLAVKQSEKDEAKEFEKNLKAIESLQAKYVKVQNQLLLSEITVQEQGVELYEMLREQLYLEKNMADLDIGMRNLRDVADIANARFERENDEVEGDRINVLTVLLAFLAIIEPFAMMLALNGAEQYEGVLWFIVSLVMFLGVLLYYKLYKGNNKLKCNSKQSEEDDCTD